MSSCVCGITCTVSSCVPVAGDMHSSSSSSSKEEATKSGADVMVSVLYGKRDPCVKMGARAPSGERRAKSATVGLSPC